MLARRGCSSKQQRRGLRAGCMRRRLLRCRGRVTAPTAPETRIDASPQVVWGVLTNLSEYSNWNPFMTSAAGRVAVGDRLVNRFEPPEGKAMTFKPVVTVVEDTEIFEWLGRAGVPGIFDGRHRFEPTPLPSGGTRFVHTEHFSGLLVRFARRSFDNHTKQGSKP